MTTRSNPSGQARHDKLLLAWQLALLRFAITTDDADRLALLAIARELDAPGAHSSARPAFKFFREASAVLCHAIINPQNPGSAAALQRHLAWSEGERLKRALAAVFAVDTPGARLPMASPKPKHDLWRGLQPQGGRRRA
jgi:hypothetical protein